MHFYEKVHAKLKMKLMKFTQMSLWEKISLSRHVKIWDNLD
jgi:hypothetical protein